MNLLFIAAEPREFRGLLKRMTHVRKAAAAVDWARTGRLGSYGVLLCANGLGRMRAAKAVDAGCSVFAPDIVISTGFCGALDDRLAVADLVVGSGVSGPEGEFAAATGISGGRPHRLGRVISVDRIARTAVEKRRLGSANAIAVEMEAAGVAARAQARSVPFYCVRAVTDLAGEDMENDFQSMLLPDGHFDTMGILRGTFERPWIRLPELVRLTSRCVRAANALGEFFANSRF
jgi:adenosylhomocysteine nucleosidase